MPQKLKKSSTCLLSCVVEDLYKFCGLLTISWLYLFRKSAQVWSTKLHQSSSKTTIRWGLQGPKVRKIFREKICISYAFSLDHFRLFSFCGISDSENDVSEPMAKTSFPIDFPKLFHALNQATHTEEGTLLLYTLLHRNEAFKSFVLASSDVDLLGGLHLL